MIFLKIIQRFKGYAFCWTVKQDDVTLLTLRTTILVLIRFISQLNYCDWGINIGHIKIWKCEYFLFKWVKI